MRLSELYRQIRSAGPDCQQFGVVLAQVDPIVGDDIDVQLSGIGWVETDFDAGQARLFPQSAVTEDTPYQQIDSVEMLLGQLPFHTGDDSDLTVVAELPLDRDRPGLILRRMTEIRALHVGAESCEVWLLTSPKEAYGSDVLPT